MQIVLPSMNTWVATVAAVALQTAPGSPSTGVTDEEVAILRELYESTHGSKWKENWGWLVNESPCDWYGVVCEIDSDHGEMTSRIVAVSLSDNDLRGTLPASLARLPNLRSLDVALNHLEGDVPPELLTRWDNHTFDFNGAKNAFSNMVKRVRVEYSASALLCAEDEDVRYIFDLEEFGPARFESIRCVPNADRETRCLVKQGDGPDLQRVSRGLDALGYQEFQAQYTYPFGLTTHQVFLTTTVEWGDGTRKTVETYGRQGPIEVWMAQQLLFGLLESVYWESWRFEPKCSFQEK